MYVFCYIYICVHIYIYIYALRVIRSLRRSRWASSRSTLSASIRSLQLPPPSRMPSLMFLHRQQNRGLDSKQAVLALTVHDGHQQAGMSEQGEYSRAEGRGWRDKGC